MSTPIWTAGTTYLPGDLVQPINAPLSSVATVLTNPGFESGSSDWTLGSNFAIVSDNKFAGINAAKHSGLGTSRVTHSSYAVTPGASITASCMYAQGAASSGDNTGRVLLSWLNSGNVELSTSLGNLIVSSSGGIGGWNQSTVTGTAPAGAAFVAVAGLSIKTDTDAVWFDAFTWNYVSTGVALPFIYQAVQAAAGSSGTSEPVWPIVLSGTVVDNQVTWQAVNTSRLEWTASPILVSDSTEPVWPLLAGQLVSDNTIAWKTVVGNVTDPKCPNSKTVIIASSKIFAVDEDIVAFSATVNPLDWSTVNDAGFLPTGLQQYGANPMAVLGLYRSNLVAFNSQGMQIWQVDQDPSRMALLDAFPVGSTFPRSISPVTNDLFYLTGLGVRTIGISAASSNLAAGDIGLPIDSLVQEKLAEVAAGTQEAFSTYFPSQGQYWLTFADVPTYAAPALPTLTGDAPDSGVNVEYYPGYTYTATGLYPPFTFSISAGALPTGLTIDAATSEITGLPTVEGLFSFTVNLTDSVGGIATLPDTIEITPFYGLLYIVNNDAPGTVTMYDPNTDLETGTIAVGNNPFRIVLSSDGLKAYVSNFGSDTVSVISTVSQTVIATIAGFNWPLALALSLDDAFLFVSNYDGVDNIVKIETTGYTTVATFAVGTDIGWMAVSIDGLKLYVSCNNIGVVAKVINIADGAVDAVIAGPLYGQQIIAAADGSEFYVGSNSGVVVISVPDYVITHTIVTDIDHPYTMTVIGNTMFAAEWIPVGSLKVIDLTTYAVTSTIVGSMPYAHGVTKSLDETEVYVVEYDYPARIHTVNVGTLLITNTTTLTKNLGFDAVALP